MPCIIQLVGPADWDSSSINKDRGHECQILLTRYLSNVSPVQRPRETRARVFQAVLICVTSIIGTHGIVRVNVPILSLGSANVVDGLFNERGQFMIVFGTEEITCSFDPFRNIRVPGRIGIRLRHITVTIGSREVLPKTMPVSRS